MIRRGIAILLAALMLLTSVPAALADTAQSADFLAQTQNGVYFKLDNSLIRVDGDVAAKVGEGSIVSVATLGDTAYCLQYGDDYALDLVQYTPGRDPVTLYEFQPSDRVSGLTAQGEEVFVLLNDLLHVIYPGNGVCAKLANAAMSEYVWMGETVYFISREETVAQTRDSLLGGSPVRKDGGVLYSLDINSGSMEKLLATGAEDLRVGGKYLYFHDLSDAYVMGTTDDEWLEGRLYRMDPATKQKTRIVNDYDWGFYPMDGGVGVYDANGVRVVAEDGAETLILQPQGVINAVPAGDGFYVFDHAASALYHYHQGQLRPVAADSMAKLMAEMGRTAQDVTPPESTVIATAQPSEAPTAAPTQAAATDAPTAQPTAQPTAVPTAEPTAKPTAAPTATPTVQPTQKPSDGDEMDGSYIFPDSDKRKLTKEEIRKVDESLWSYGRNEIFARHGYDFGNSKYQAYFEQKSWYWKGGFSTSDLNSIEWYNMQLLKEMEGITGSDDSNNSGSTSSGYIFANSSKKKLTREQILSIDKSLWPYARNEIYARHGYSFKTAKFRNYFKKKSWYKEGGFSTGDLNSIEWYNMDLLKQMEKEYGVK